MKKIVITTLFLSTMLFATVNVAVSYPFIEALTEAVGGKQVSVTALAKGDWDPHFVVPRPSLIRQVAKADLLIINGAGLEIGWMPPLIRQSHNAHIQPGGMGFLDLSQYVTLINKPKAVSRANGDIHPDGNPHYATDPYVMLKLSQAIANRLGQLDPEHAKIFTQRAAAFNKKWQKNLTRWDQMMKPLSGTKLIQYHELFNYFLKRYKLISIGNIEPLPGINPSSRHTLALIRQIKAEGAKLILQDVYHSPKSAKYIAEKTGAKTVVLPHDVSALSEVNSLEKLYDTIIDRVLHP